MKNFTNKSCQPKKNLLLKKKFQADWRHLGPSRWAPPYLASWWPLGALFYELSDLNWNPAGVLSMVSMGFSVLKSWLGYLYGQYRMSISCDVCPSQMKYTYKGFVLPMYSWNIFQRYQIALLGKLSICVSIRTMIPKMPNINDKYIDHISSLIRISKC